MQTNSLGDLIRQCRTQSGLTQLELGYRIGSSQHYIWRVENGRIDPSWSRVESMAAALGRRIYLERPELEKPVHYMPVRQEDGRYGIQELLGEERVLARDVTDSLAEAQRLALLFNSRRLSAVHLPEAVKDYRRERELDGVDNSGEGA